VNPEFLDLDDVVEIHRSLIDEYGGSHGVRDFALLESAVAQPRAGFSGQYLHVDTFEMAAAYVFHMIRNHPFVDGNKRVGVQCALTFLEINGFSIDRPSTLLEETALRAARGGCDKHEVAEVLRGLVRARPD
jgi:death on curing protein